MDENQKLSLLNEELDEESTAYITESIQQWKESVMAQLQEEVEEAKRNKLEELEEANNQYREELREEFSDKLTTALAEMRETVVAEATADVLKNNPELSILEQIKGLVAPLLNEDYRDNAYADTIAQLSEENDALKREHAIMEGAQTLSELLAPYNEKTQKFVLSLIKEGDSEEVTEQFYEIMESLQDVFGEAEGDESDEGNDEDESDDDGKKKSKKSDDDESDDDDDDDDNDDDDEGKLGEGYINEGFDGDDLDDEEPSKNLFRNIALQHVNN